MKDFISTTIRVALLFVFGITALCGYAGGSTQYYHFVNVRSCDSAKGLVYADTVSIKDNPVFVESVDLKWVDEIYGPEEDMPDRIYDAVGLAKPNPGYIFTGWSQNQVTPFLFANPAELYSEAKTEVASEDGGEFPSVPDDVFYAHFGKVACNVAPESDAYNLGEVTTSNPDNMPGDDVVFTAIPWGENVYLRSWLKDGKPYSSANPLHVIAQDEPATYYALFDVKTEGEFNFDSGEWRLYYNKTNDALLPTNADFAYMVPTDKLSDSYYYLVATDTLKAGCVYLVHGSGSGKIEYFTHDALSTPEIDSPLMYAEQDTEVNSVSFDAYFVLDIENLDFKRLPYGDYTIPKGSAYVRIDPKDSETIQCVGVLKPTLDYLVGSYHCVNYVDGTEGMVYGPKYLSMTYNKYTGHYDITKFFDYNHPQIYADIVDGTLTDINIPLVSGFLEFNNTLADLGPANDGCRELALLFPMDTETRNIKVTSDGGNSYTMTPFSVYQGHSNAGEWNDDIVRLMDISQVDMHAGAEGNYVYLDRTSLSLNVGDTFTLYATVVSNSVTEETLTWTSSDPAIVSVDDKGTVTALGVGEAVITASFAGVSASCTVKVNPIEAVSVTLDREYIYLYTGETDRLVATVLPENTTDKTVVWTSSAPDIATVDQDGNIQAGETAGYTIITATCGNVSASCEVTVEFKHVTEIQLDKTELTLTLGETATLNVSYIPADAFIKDVTWRTTDGTVATVNNDGVITAVGLGEADIIAVAVFSTGDVTATCHITVVPVEAVSVTLDRDRIYLFTGETDRLIATVLPENTTDKTVVWTSSAPEIATVDQDGNVQAGEYGGHATITATCGNASASCEITVEYKHVTEIQLDKTELTLTLGETATLNVTYIPADAFIKNVTWRTTDGSVVTVNNDGVITAVGLGEADIIAESVFSTGHVTSTCHITVVPIEAEYVVLNMTMVTMKTTETVALTATVLPYDTTDPTVIWTSSDDGIATVDQSGLVTAISIGNAVITASCGNASASCYIDINGEGGINDIIIDSLSAPVDIYTLQGIKVRSNTTDLGGLPRGFYIINGQKRYVK